MKYRAILGLKLALAVAAPVWAEETRQLVKLPEMMQEHMLGNMRDHVKALNAILEALAAGDADKAAQVAEKRLGMSSLESHGAAHMAPFMPAGMRTIGTRMHKTASRFAIVVKNAELARGGKGAREVFDALKEITDNCVACHDAYRIR